MAKKFKFGKEKIEALRKPAEGQRLEVQDTQVPGLSLRVTSNGTKTFCVFRRVKGGEPIRVTIGRFPDVSVEQAQKQARNVIGQAAQGVNVAEIRRAGKIERTFADLFSEYIERHAKQNKRTWREDEQRYQQYLATPLGKKKLSAIDRKAISAIHNKISSDGHPAVANRVVALLGSVFNKALYWELIAANPAKGVKKNPEVSRDRFIQADELPAFFKALADEPNEGMRDFFLLSLLTGARRDNMLSMRWQDIALQRAEWRILRTKNGTPQTVTLSPEAVEILTRRVEKAEDKALYVFPGLGKRGHLTEPKGAWQRVLDRAGLSDLRIHDLRRTLGSWQAREGASMAIIGKSLNHKSMLSTAVYARLDLDPVRDSVNRATASMFNAGGMKSTAEIVPLNRKRA